MIEQFTETFENFLSGKEENWLSTQLSAFPNFVFENENLDIDIDLSFADLFKQKFDLREIGAETEELFEHFLLEKINENVIKYVPKISMWLENFNKLFEFVLELNYQNNSGSGTTNTYYLNPANKGNPETEFSFDEDGKPTFTHSNTLKTEDLDDTTRASFMKGKREVLQSVWGKTRPMILKQILELKDVYNECLNSFETIFMGLY